MIIVEKISYADMKIRLNINVQSKIVIVDKLPFISCYRIFEELEILIEGKISSYFVEKQKLLGSWQVCDRGYMRRFDDI